MVEAEFMPRLDSIACFLGRLAVGDGILSWAAFYFPNATHQFGRLTLYSIF